MIPDIRAPFLASVTLLVTAACGSSQKGAQSSDQAPPVTKTETREELAALFEREMELPGNQKMESPNGAWSTQVHALSPPVVSIDEDGMVSTEISIARDQEVECFFYDDSLDTGQALMGVLTHLAGGVQFTRVAGYRVGEASGYPVVFVEGLYLFEQNGEKAMGSVKLGVSPRFETPVLCVFDSPGYRDTFAEFMTDLLRNLQTQEQSTKPAFVEIWGYQMNDIPVGYEMTRVLDPGTGTITSISLSTNLYPVSPSELSTSDKAEIIVSDATGLLTGHYVQIENRRPEFDIELARKAQNKYEASGTLKGKEFQTSFSVQNGLSDTVSFYRYLERTRGSGGTLDALQYSPDLDPSAPTKTHYELDGQGRELRIVSGNLALSANRDASGLPVKVTVPLGDREMRATLIYRVGEL